MTLNPNTDIITTASNTATINTESDYSGFIIKYNDSYTVEVKPKRPDPIKCTGFRCNTMIPQQTKRNKIKLCKRCQNEVYRRVFKR